MQSNEESRPLNWDLLARLGRGKAGKFEKAKGARSNQRAAWSSCFLRRCFSVLNNAFAPVDARVKSNMSRAFSVPYGNVAPDPYWGPQTSAVKYVSKSSTPAQLERLLM
jgi:hypothetical protein